MIGWLIAGAVAHLIGAGWAFVGSLMFAIFFPRLTQFLFASLVFPVYTLFFGTWSFLIGWMFNLHEFAWESWKTSVAWTAIPVAIVTWYLARSVRSLGIDKLNQ